MLVNYNDQIKTLNSLRTGEFKQGLRLGIPEIDEYFVMKPQDFGIWLGHANVGKTSLTVYLMLLYAIKHEQKFLIYSSENEPYELIQKLLEFIKNLVLIGNKTFMKVIDHLGLKKMTLIFYILIVY